MLALVVAGSPTSAIAAAPMAQVDPRWPVVAAGPLLLPGPGDGVVTAFPAIGGDTYLVAALSPQGAVQWQHAFSPGCGMCEGESVPERTLDGSYGTFGPRNAQNVLILPSGAVRAGCPGAITPTGACIAAMVGEGPHQGMPLISASQASAPVAGQPSRAWTTRVAGFIATTRDVENPNGESVAVDGAGTAYAVFTAGPYSGPRTDSLLVAVDVATGSVRWQQQTPSAQADLRTLAAMPRGVLVHRRGPGGDTVSAVRDDGSVAWQVPAPFDVSDARVVVDGSSNRAYLLRPGVPVAPVALDLTTGSVAWTTDNRARFLAAGPRGALLGFDDQERHELRAVTPSGEPLWTWTSLVPVEAAAWTPAGPAYVSAGGNLVRVRPGTVRTPRAMAATAVSVNPARACVSPARCRYTGREGVLVRVDVPRAGVLSLVHRATPPIRGRVDAGRYWVRWGTLTRSGTLRVALTTADGRRITRTVALRFPSTTPPPVRTATRT